MTGLLDAFKADYDTLRSDGTRTSLWLERTYAGGAFTRFCMVLDLDPGSIIDKENMAAHEYTLGKGAQVIWHSNTFWIPVCKLWQHPNKEEIGNAIYQKEWKR